MNPKTLWYTSKALDFHVKDTKFRSGWTHWRCYCNICSCPVPM